MPVDPPRPLDCTARIVLRIHVAVVRPRLNPHLERRGPALHASTHRARAPRP